MRLLTIAIVVAMWGALGAARAQDAAPATPEAVTEFAGKWHVTDAEAKLICMVMLSSEATIGGNVIEVAPGCATAFPVMDEIAAWRMYENGDIVFADATRKERLRFYTPDDSYISVEDVDGIVRLTPAGEP